MLTFLLLAGRFDVHGVEREAWFSWDGKVGDAQRVHLFLSLVPGAALWGHHTTHSLSLLVLLLLFQPSYPVCEATYRCGFIYPRFKTHFYLVPQHNSSFTYLLQLLQTLRNVEGDVDERPVGLILERHTHTEGK